MLKMRCKSWFNSLRFFGVCSSLNCVNSSQISLGERNVVENDDFLAGSVFNYENEMALLFLYSLSHFLCGKFRSNYSEAMIA